MSKRNFGFNDEGRGSLIEVLCTVNYTLCTLVCPFKIIRHTLTLIILSRSCSLVLKISFVQKISFFACSKYFLLYVFFFFPSCECWFIYNLLSMTSFSYGSRWCQINSGKVYWHLRISIPFLLLLLLLLKAVERRFGN